ncbi:MAG: (Fe-S)-binding protein, partial [Pseudomonadota bacterium]
MARPNPHRPFTPDPEFQALLPQVYGNAVNGLGETEPRRPSMVWWAPDMDAVEFGPAQKWFYGHEPPDPRLMEQRARRRA